MTGSRFRAPFAGFRWWSAAAGGIWLPTLIVPLVAADIARVPASISAVLFALVFLVAAGSHDYYPRGMNPRNRRLAWLFLLLALVAVAAVFMAQWAIVFMPFLAGYLAYSSSARPALTTIFALGLPATAIAIAVDPEQGVLYVIWGLAVPMFVYLMALLSNRGYDSQQLRHELEMTRQRESFARDVHDLLGHSLTVITLKAEVARRHVHSDPDAAEAELAEIAELSRQGLAEARSTVTRTRQPGLAGELAASARAFATAGIEAELPAAVPDPTGVLAWVLREATTNILRHARASHVRVELTPTSITVSDDGVGFVPGAEEGGLAGLARRVHDVAGEFHVRSAPGAGTTLSARLGVGA